MHIWTLTGDSRGLLVVGIGAVLSFLLIYLGVLFGDVRGTAVLFGPPALGTLVIGVALLRSTTRVVVETDANRITVERRVLWTTRRSNSAENCAIELCEVELLGTAGFVPSQRRWRGWGVLLVGQNLPCRALALVESEADAKAFLATLPSNILVRTAITDSFVLGRQ
jgi:hypothetical protein